MSSSLDCPESASWQRLFADAVPADQRERFEQHLESCQACQALLDRPEGDEELLALAREVGDPTHAAADATLVQVVDFFLTTKNPNRSTQAEPADLYFLSPEDRPDVLGVLGAYHVQEVIGQGGMGVVLKAFDPALNRLVAIKVMAAAVAGSAVARKRFTREAQAAAAVCHEHIVAVHGVHEADGLPYLVMQYVEGESLQARLDRMGALSTEEVVRIGMQTALGLAAAHARGLIHRDVKPANLLLSEAVAPHGTDGTKGTHGSHPSHPSHPFVVKITDFGLARMVDDVQLTQNGVVAGTPEYMAPEQARGESVDHRADLFSLGSVLYAMCTGAPPFHGSTALAVLRQVSEQTPPAVREVNPETPVWLESLIARLMAKDPADRFQSAAEVAALLERCLTHLRQPGTAPLPEWPAAPMRNKRTRPAMSPRKWLLLAVGIGSLLGLLGGLAALVLRPTASRGLIPAAAAPQAVSPMDGLVCLLVNKNSGRCLSIAGATNPGAKVVQGPKPEDAGAGERWILRGGPAFRLLNERSRLVLEIGSANPRPGVQAIQWHDQRTLANQHWTFEPAEDGWRLRVEHSKLVLCIAQGSLDEGGRAVQWRDIPDVPDQIWELRAAGGSDRDAGMIREAYYYDFRTGQLPSELTVLDEARFVKPTPEGLRITLPKDRTNLEPVRIATSFGVRGDFEITAAFTILQAEEPSSGQGVGPVLRIHKVGAAPNLASAARLVLPPGTHKTIQLVVGNHQHAPAPGQKLTYEEGVAPCTAKVGRLRLKRTGSILHYLWADGVTGPLSLPLAPAIDLKNTTVKLLPPADDFQEFHHCDFGTEDVERITLLAGTGRKPGFLDVRWIDLRIQGEAAPTQAAGLPPADIPARARWTWWFAAAGAVPVCLAVWLLVRHRRRAGKRPAGTPEPAVPEAVSFACGDCGKQLKARVELAGKKVKCLQCGKAVLVPAQ